VPDTLRGNHLHIVRPRGLNRNSLHAAYAFCMKLRYIGKLPTALFLALSLMSVFAHADDSSLLIEANTALTKKDYNSAFSKFAVLAQHGNAIAQFNLGAFYINGQGVQRDEKQAYGWFAKSAAQGYAHALQVIQSAAARGNENAKNELSRLQQQTASLQPQPPGQSQQPSSVVADDKTLWVEANTALTKKDYYSAFPKFAVLAQHGNAIAQFNLGAFYINGQGVQRDEKQAYGWFAKSAAQGYARALQVIQSAAAKGNVNAKNAYEGLAQTTTPAALPSALDVRPKANATTAATHSGSEHSNEPSSSAFSLGASLGQTGKLTGIKNSSSFGLLVGYKFNSSFGVELAYNSLYRNANADTFISATNPGSTGTFDLTSLSVAGQYTYGLTSNWSLLGNLGFHSSSFNFKSSGNASGSGSSSGLVAGLKVQYELSKSIGIRGGFDTYTQRGGITGTVTEVGLAVIYKF
jgi:TPR repeat protein